MLFLHSLLFAEWGIICLLSEWLSGARITAWTAKTWPFVGGRPFWGTNSETCASLRPWGHTSKKLCRPWSTNSASSSAMGRRSPGSDTHMSDEMEEGGGGVVKIAKLGNLTDGRSSPLRLKRDANERTSKSAVSERILRLVPNWNPTRSLGITKVSRWAFGQLLCVSLIQCAILCNMWKVR